MPHRENDWRLNLQHLLVDFEEHRRHYAEVLATSQTLAASSQAHIEDVDRDILKIHEQLSLLDHGD